MTHAGDNRSDCRLPTNFRAGSPISAGSSRGNTVNSNVSFGRGGFPGGGSRCGGQSKLAPSKSTVYVGNLPYSLTNNDVIKVFEKYGKVVKVTILSDKATRRSKGVAFVQFLEIPSAHQACQAVNQKQMFDRKLTCKIATDNGRAAEFIKRREYPDKSKCYECGQEGHLSYNCPRNILGDREPPPKKMRKTKEEKAAEKLEKFKNMREHFKQDSDNECPEEEGEDLAKESLGAVIQQEALEADEIIHSQRFYRGIQNNEVACPSAPIIGGKRNKYKTSSYFSDEEEEDDEDD